MATILDYVDWRGDLPVSVSPFNEVDNQARSCCAQNDPQCVHPEQCKNKRTRHDRDSQRTAHPCNAAGQRDRHIANNRRRTSLHA